MTQSDQIDKMVNAEIVRAENALAKWYANTIDDEVVIAFIDCSGMKALWQVVFQDIEDNDFQIDIDNAVRGLL